MEECVDTAVTARDGEELKKVEALMTGLSEAPLGEVLAHLTAVDASNFAVSFEATSERSAAKTRPRRCALSSQ